MTPLFSPVLGLAQCGARPTARPCMIGYSPPKSPVLGRPRGSPLLRPLLLAFAVYQVRPSLAVLMPVGLQLRDLPPKIGDLVGEVCHLRAKIGEAGGKCAKIGDLAELVGEATHGGGLLDLAGGEGCE